MLPNGNNILVKDNEHQTKQVKTKTKIQRKKKNNNNNNSNNNNNNKTRTRHTGKSIIQVSFALLDLALDQQVKLQPFNIRSPNLGSPSTLCHTVQFQLHTSISFCRGKKCKTFTNIKLLVCRGRMRNRKVS